MTSAARILEGIVTTTNDDGSPNISPMGPAVDEAMSVLVLRPYQSSTTYRNLKRSRQGVLHVTDDVELLARAAVGRLDRLPALRPAERVEGNILSDACRWYEFEVFSLDDSQPRVEIMARVVAHGVEREFFGFNRAMHAVVEAAIVATRIDFLPPDQIREEFTRFSVPVQKTAGPREQRAFDFLRQYVDEALAARGA